MDRAAAIREHEAFRSVLEAVARPGTVRDLVRGGLPGDAALDLLLDCLLDPECSLGVLDEGILPAARGARERTGCAGARPESADFALCGPDGAGARLLTLRQGEPEYPDRSCTVVYRVRGLSALGGRWLWSGPGIRDGIRPKVDGIPDSEWRHLKAANAVYPMGIDCLFLDDRGRIAAMPRSVRIEEVD